MITATCLTVAAILASAQGGETIELIGQDCPALTIARIYSPPVKIEASGSIVRGLAVTGGGIDWNRGTLVATKGRDGVGPDGYAARVVNGAINVRFTGVTFTEAKIGLVTGAARAISVTDSRFIALRGDGVNAAGTRNLSVTRSLFADPRPRPTECHTATAVELGLSSRACLALGGAWKDGDHADAVQMRNGVIDAKLEHNTILGRQQGFSVMDTTGDALNVRVAIRRNTFITDNPHKATLGNCTGCSILENVVLRPTGSTWKAIIVPGPALRCGNLQEDARVQDAPCP